MKTKIILLYFFFKLLKSIIFILNDFDSYYLKKIIRESVSEFYNYCFLTKEF